MVSWHNSCKTVTLIEDSSRGCLVLSWSNWRNPATWGPGTSCTYGRTIAPSICGGMNLVSPLKAMGLRISLRLKALASSLLRSPPGVCLWSPHQTTRPLRGSRAMAGDSSRFPYCWPSSLRAMSTSLIHLATGLYGCEHSWWKPPPQPMITCFPRKTSLRKPGGTSNLVLLAGPFSSSVTPTNRPNLSSMEGGSWRDSMRLAKACAAAFSLVTTMTLSAGSITSKPAIIAAAGRAFPAPKTLLMGQSVLPSKMDCTNAVSTAKVGWPVTVHLLPQSTLFQKPMRWKHAGQIGATSPKQQTMDHAHLDRWEWKFLPPGAHTLSTAVQGPCW